MTELRDDKPMWGVGEVLSLAFPAAAGMLGSTIMQFVDRLMVSKLVGPEAFSAQFVSAITAFVPTSLVMGIIIVVNTFVSQNLGAGRLRRCGQYAWHGLYLAIFLGALMMPLAAVSGPLFAAVRGLIAAGGGESTSAGELALQRVYFSYLILGMPLMLMSRAMGQFFYGIGRPWIVVVVTLSSVCVNVVANYALITGAGPLPAMGLKGAAIGTLIGWGFAFVLLLLYFLYAKAHRPYHTRTAWPLWCVGFSERTTHSSSRTSTRAPGARASVRGWGMLLLPQGRTSSVPVTATGAQGGRGRSSAVVYYADWG